MRQPRLKLVPEDAFHSQALIPDPSPGATEGEPPQTVDCSLANVSTITGKFGQHEITNKCSITCIHVERERKRKLFKGNLL
jgi:hypothetical protein